MNKGNAGITQIKISLDLVKDSAEDRPSVRYKIMKDNDTTHLDLTMEELNSKYNHPKPPKQEQVPDIRRVKEDDINEFLLPP